jgi:uracil-DNA glycosylase
MKFNNDWHKVLKDCIDSPEFRTLCGKVDDEYKTGKICPPRELVFAAFDLCSFENVKVVILGQDPYFNPNQAVGLAFSVQMYGPEKSKTMFPPSLRNIIKQVRADMGICTVEDGDLRPWARQGVLLLNTSLTVRLGNPLSHANIGWDCVVNSAISALNEKDDIVFMLWGSHARGFKKFLTNPRNLVLECAHPSPLSAHNGFFGCGHFKKASDFLVSRGKQPIVF